MKRLYVHLLLCVAALAFFLPWLNASCSEIEKTESISLLENSDESQYQNSPAAIYAKFGVLFSMTNSFSTERDKSGEYAAIKPLAKLKAENAELKNARIRKVSSGIEFSWKVEIMNSIDKTKTCVSYRFFYNKKENRLNCDATEKIGTWYERLGLTKADIKNCGLTKSKLKKLGESGLASLLDYCESRLWANASIKGRYTGIDTLDATKIGYKFS